MATAMAPATDAIMGSLPEAKMSVGSAINDTTRVAGGALGVAVLGSLLASGYRGDMDSAVSALPAQAREVAQDSLGGRAWPSVGDDRLAAAAQDAFVSGMHTAALVAAAVALAGALVAAVFLPSRERAPGAGGRARVTRRPGPRLDAAARAAALGRGRRGDPAGRARAARRDGYRALTMERVRERSGVGKATLYRRYGSKEELVRAAIVHLNADIPMPEDTGSMVGRLRRHRADDPGRARRAPAR